MQSNKFSYDDQKPSRRLTLRQVSGDKSINIPLRKARAVLFLTLTAVTSFWGLKMMFDILRSNGTTALEVVLLILFSATFIWITTAFWSGLMGFILQLFKIDPLTLKKSKTLFERSHTRVDATDPLEELRTAVVMPVYNEDTHRVFSGFEATIQSILETGQASKFDFYLLSDTQDPTIRLAELEAWQVLLKQLGNYSNCVFYRNRPQNSGKKVGNLRDFCERWGGFYESMIVLDADSVMTGQCMVELARRLHANPKIGLLQTVPIPVRQETFFGRFLQFAAQLCCPMLATGLAFWQTDNANYWGHNAIIRIKAFKNHCGLPTINKRSPFGGDILSHDFVEAALLRRDGWDVVLLPNLEGSYEEVPSNILDYATRDRRWIQGNIQHLGLLSVPRLTLLSKMHFLFGALAYITSLIWLVMLCLSTVDAITRALTKNEFFTSAHQLFPNWPIAKPDLIFSLLFLTFTLLLLPKILAIILASVHRRKEFGGILKLLFGSVVEIIFAMIIAPIMMVFHASFVVFTFLGYKVSWNAQPREGRLVSWTESIKYSGLAAIIALMWGGITAYYSTVFFYWLLPVLFGMVCGPLIIRWSSSKQLGLAAKKWGIFIAPSEVTNSTLLQYLSDRLTSINTSKLNAVASDSKRISLIPKLPAEFYEPMPIQKF